MPISNNESCFTNSTNFTIDLIFIRSFPNFIIYFINPTFTIKFNSCAPQRTCINPLTQMMKESSNKQEIIMLQQSIIVSCII